MIFKSKDSRKLIVQCDSGRESLEFQSFDWENGAPKEYFISVLIRAWYNEQDGFFARLWNRLKLILNILVHGVHTYTEIFLTEDDLKDLKEIIKDWE